MDNICNAVIQYDLSGDNILTLCRNRVKLHLYHDLLKFNNIIDAIGKFKRMILLFPTKLDNNVSGHWVAVLLTGRVITHFDSYAFSWEKELGYSTNQDVKRNLLGDLYKKAMGEGYTVNYNTFALQKMANNINTCGRWCAMRVRFQYLDSEEFASLFYHQKLTPDMMITYLTFIGLKEDELDEQQIIRTTMNKP